jgi:hypothetical protein
MFERMRKYTYKMNNVLYAREQKSLSDMHLIIVKNCGWNLVHHLEVKGTYHFLAPFLITLSLHICTYVESTMGMSICQQGGNSENLIIQRM